jgi:hypothetical protein
MKFAIYRSTGAIIAAIDADVLSEAELPTLADGGYLTIDDPTYTSLSDGMFDSYGIPLYRNNAGTVDNRVPQSRWWIVVDQGDNVVGGVWSYRGRTPKTPANLRLVEVDQATHDMVESGQYFEDSTIPRWSVDGNDNLVENVDTRFVLEVAASATDIASGSPVDLTLTLKDSGDQVVNYSGTRQISLQHDGAMKQARVTFNAGVAQVLGRVLAEGLWSVISIEPDQYRVSGDTVLRVSEAW